MLYDINLMISLDSHLRGAVDLVEDQGVIYGLRDLNNPLWKDDPSEHRNLFSVRVLGPGVYVVGGIGLKTILDYFENADIAELDAFNPEGTPVDIGVAKGPTKRTYGVCDNLEQVLKHFAPVIDKPDVHVAIEMRQVMKKDQPEFGGWRWSKNGQYIGNRQYQAEYLADEPEIEFVWQFRGFFMQPKPEPSLKPSSPKKR